MRSLILARHAKSDWNADYGDDANRPLSKRGRKSAGELGDFLARSGELPDAAIASPAVRARETLRLAMAAGGWHCPHRLAGGLYGGLETALVEIRQEPDSTKVLLVVGHEPTTSNLASELIGGGQLRVVTAACLRIDFEGDRWSTLGAGDGTLAWLVVPRLLA